MSEIILSIVTELRLESRSKIAKKQCLGSNNQGPNRNPMQQSQKLQMDYSRKTRESTSHLETRCQVWVGAGIGWE